MLTATTPDITINATVGSPKMVIYGYAPSNSSVYLNGIGVSSNTQADTNGYYLFDPVYTYDFSYPEICVQATDENKRTTQPTCIPPIPAEELMYKVGPVLLSPTISIDENGKVLGASTFLEGKTAPDTEVNIYMAKSYFIPTIQTKSNKDGNFSITLPTADASNYKIFVASKFSEDLSAKSNTLTFVVTSKVESLWDRLIAWISKNKLAIIISLEGLAVITLSNKLLKSITKKQKRHTGRDHLEYLKF